MNGELLFLDGVVYQLLPGGETRKADESDQIPFAVSTNFVPQRTTKVELRNKDDVDNALNAFNDHAANLFMTYRIDGHFDHIKCRTVKGQEYVDVLEPALKRSLIDHEQIQRAAAFRAWREAVSRDV